MDTCAIVGVFLQRSRWVGVANNGYARGRGVNKPIRFGDDLVLLSLIEAWKSYTVSQAMMRRWLRQALYEGVGPEQISGVLARSFGDDKTTNGTKDLV